MVNMETIVNGETYTTPNRVGERRGEYTWKPLPSIERHAKVSRIPGRHFLSPYEVFGILEMGNKTHIGGRSVELRCGREAGVSTVKCISVPVERCDATPNEDGDKDIKRRL